jgi:flavorubredoxin
MLFNDLVDQHELYAEAIKYYATFLTHLVNWLQKNDEIVKLNLPVDLICPSHGIVWRDNPLQIVAKYSEWANSYNENQITVIYDTMYNGTRAIAENIVKGINATVKHIAIKLYISAKNDKNDMITDIFRSKAVLVGSPTVNNGILSSIAGLLEMVKGMKFMNKKAAAFGCYGWHDVSTKVIEDTLKESGFEILLEPLRFIWSPDDEVPGQFPDNEIPAAPAILFA